MAIKIHIVNYEFPRYNGILSKFANKLYDELKKEKGIKITTSNKPDPKADINHHINYQSYRHVDTINTLMVTHIWEGRKLDFLRESLKTADVGICMSNDTRERLIEWKLPAAKLETILPAHDGTPRRYQVVSILTNIYPDGCKREGMFDELMKVIDFKKWAFRIMGDGWREILIPWVAKGLQVDYFPEWEPENYARILESSDYNLYFGEDEGSMGVLDAKNAGLKIIAPPVGFNMDVGVDYPFHNQKDLNFIFENININPVEDWTWKKYTQKHLHVWKKLLS